MRFLLLFYPGLPVPGPTDPRPVAEAMGAFPLAGAMLGAVLVALPICSIGVWRFGRWIPSALGGLTGDSYGAIAELTEVLALLVFALGVGGL